MDLVGEVSVECFGLHCHVDAEDLSLWGAAPEDAEGIVWLPGDGAVHGYRPLYHVYPEEGEYASEVVVYVEDGDGSVRLSNHQVISVSDDAVAPRGQEVVRLGQRLALWSLKAQYASVTAFHDAIPDIEAVGPDTSASLPCDAGGTFELDIWEDWSGSGEIDGGEEGDDSTGPYPDRVVGDFAQCASGAGRGALNTIPGEDSHLATVYRYINSYSSALS